jgi:hypothetical protein
MYGVTGDAIIRAGCIDITSEGGRDSPLLYRSATTPVDVTSVLINNDNADGEAIIAIRAPLLYDGKTNTRDALLNRITTFCKDEATTAVYITRDPAVLGGIATNANPLLGWAPTATDSAFEYMIGGHNSLLETTFETNHSSGNTNRLVSVRQEMDMPNIIVNPNPQSAPFYLTAGDYIIVTGYPDADNAPAGCTVEWSEEI